MTEYDKTTCDSDVRDVAAQQVDPTGDLPQAWSEKWRMATLQNPVVDHHFPHKKKALKKTPALSRYAPFSDTLENFISILLLPLDVQPDSMMSESVEPITPMCHPNEKVWAST